MTKHNRFAKGSGAYECRSCTRLTRDCGDGARVLLCEACYDLAGYQNSISDNGPGAFGGEALEVCRRSAKTILAKGGKLDWADAFWAELGEHAQNALHEMALAEDAGR